MATKRVTEIRASKKHAPRGRRKPLAKGVSRFKGMLGRANRRRGIERSRRKYNLPTRASTPRTFNLKLGDFQSFNCPWCRKRYGCYQWDFGRNKCECGSVIIIEYNWDY